MKLQTLRAFVQLSSLSVVILIPVMESYKRLLFYLPPEYVGSVWQLLDSLKEVPDFLKGGYMSLLVVGLDSLLGNLFENARALQNFLTNFGGSYWSVTLGGLTIIDPLALLQVLTLMEPVTLSLFISAIIPIILALIFGRIFCSWLCPINTILETNRRLIKKIGLKPLKINVITSSKLRYVLLIPGLIFPFLGAALFPYILPYAVLGRFMYYLTVGTIFWTGLLVLLAVFIGDYVQKGFWCNYLCPTGLLLSFAGTKRLINVVHDLEKCNTYCSLCEKTCSWNTSPKQIPNHNCTNCGLCIEKCPGKALVWGRKDREGKTVSAARKSTG